jgi:hypothetical protein
LRGLDALSISPFLVIDDNTISYKIFKEDFEKTTLEVHELVLSKRKGLGKFMQTKFNNA